MDKDNAVEKFFADLPSEDKKEADIFGDKEAKKPVADTEKKPEEGDEPRKNRRHRRLEQQLAEEREARIRLEAQIAARSEASKFDDNKSDDVDDRWLRIYGDTPETRQAWKLQKDILNDYATRAKEEALKEVEARKAEEAQRQRQYESMIDSRLEAIEDEYNVDVTSDSPAARKARREFLEMVETLSPKDEDGTITGYADFNATWEIYQLKRGQEKSSATTERQKELASRSMSKSGTAAPQERQITPGFNGWRKDLGL